MSHRQTRMHPRTVQPSPDDGHPQSQLPTLSHDSQQQQPNDHFSQLQHQLGFDDPRLQKLEASPYRQKLYFKKQAAKNGGPVAQIRSPSVTQNPGNGANNQINPMFPPTEYFNNLKNAQMRHTHQEGFNKQQRPAGPRSNSILVNRDKLHSMAQAPIMTVDQSSQLPKTFRMTPGGTVVTTMQSSINQDFIVDQDYHSSILQSQQSKLQSRGIRYYNRVVEKFENKFYQNKTRPSSIKKRAEEIYDDNIQLKHQINQLKEQITLQQTQNKLLNNELEKQNHLMTQILCGAQQSLLTNRNNNGMLPPPHVIIEELTVKQSELVINLKRELDKALKDIVEKDNEIKNIHKQTKVTKYRELEEECRTYMNECFRLHRVLKKFLTERATTPSQQQSVVVQQPSYSNLAIAPINGSVESISKQLHDLTERANFLKNQNSKLKEDCNALRQRCEVQAQSIKGFKDQNARFASENESLKPLKEQVHLLNIEIERLKAQKDGAVVEKPPVKEVIVASTKQSVAKGSTKNDEVYKVLEDKNSQISKLQIQIQQLESIHKLELEKANDRLQKTETLLNESREKLKESEEKINQLHSQITFLKDSQTQSANSQIEKLEKDKEHLNKAVSELEGQIFTLNQQISQLKSSIQENQDLAEQENHKLKSKYDAHIKQSNSDNSVKDQQISELKEQLNRLQSLQKDSSHSQEKSISVLKEQIVALKQSHDDSMKVKDQEILNLKETVKNLSNSAASEQDFISSQIDEKNQQIDKLKSSISEHAANTEQLNKQLTAKQKEIARQATHIEALTNEIETLRLSKESVIDEDTSEKDQKIEELQLEIDILKSQCKDLSTSNQNEQSKLQNEIKQLQKDYDGKIDTKQKEIKSLQQQIQTLQTDLEQQSNYQKSEDQGLMQKLEQLMVSLQLKEKDMKDQARQIVELKKDAQIRDEEIIELNDQLNAKDAEIITVKNYFEKSELDQDELRQQMDALQDQNAKLIKTIEKLQIEADNAKKKAQEGSKNAWEMDSLKGEIETLKQQLEDEKNNQLLEIQSRFTRCLEILQINDQKGLTGFLKSNDKSSDEHIEEFVAMKFNMTKEESTLLLHKVLQLSGKFTKADVINAFITKIGNQVVIIDKDKTAKAYQQLTSKIITKYLSIDQFFSMVNLDKSKIMHYYMMEKVLFSVFDQTKGSQLAVNAASLIHMIITHLLNQSRNFYQIDIKVFRENLELHHPSADKQGGMSTSKIPSSTLSGQKKEETEEEEEEEEEEEQQEEDDYYDQEDYGGEAIDDEEKQINQAEDKQRTIIFNQAIKTLKSTGKEPKDTGMVIQINQKEEKEQSSPGYSKALSASLKGQKSQNPMLQQLCKFLVQGKINLRSFLKVYHAGPKEIPFHEKEFEAISFEELLYFINQQNVFSVSDLQKLTDSKNAKLEDGIEQMLDSMQCMHEVPKMGVQLIELRILVEHLESCGYQDYQRPKSKRNFDFAILDLKSIRIMNRLTQRVYKDVEKFMITHKINGGLTKDQNKTLLQEVIESMFKDVLKTVNVQAKTRKEKVYLIQKEDFFKKLNQLGIKGKPTTYDNLCQFLRIDSQYPNLLYLRKVIRGIELFNTNGYFNSVGMRVSNYIYYFLQQYIESVNSEFKCIKQVQRQQQWQSEDLAAE